MRGGAIKSVALQRVQRFSEHWPIRMRSWLAHTYDEYHMYEALL